MTYSLLTTPTKTGVPQRGNASMKNVQSTQCLYINVLDIYGWNGHVPENDGDATVVERTRTGQRSAYGWRTLPLERVFYVPSSGGRAGRQAGSHSQGQGRPTRG